MSHTIVVGSVKDLLLRAYRMVLILKWVDAANLSMWSLYNIINKDIPISTRSFKLLIGFMKRLKLLQP